ncbi:hypothetical protein JJJ40_004611 [Salmonella enterica]|nr:hypothetical protein [Salmonella enterica]EEE2903074.1 hypothetical protein [Salmonella enterica subsp. enterica serovar Braenderup]HCL1641410.1 hypothetical protein [Salmonella enterica subsp. enterica serovar 4,[5],12:i:-]ECR8416784.1 hypothetical protein [Salmonella enterica]EDI1682088.1 hypothetical protein [Salmonella enterica]
MKNYIFFLVGLFFFIPPSLSFADNGVDFIPTVTVRGVFTGFVFRNNILSPDSDDSVHYDLVEVSDPAFPLSQYPYGIVQFREPEGFRASDFCAQPEDNKITTYFCSFRGVNLTGTYFSLIPTNTGAVLIKNIITGKCLSSGSEGTGFPDLEKCILNPSQSEEPDRQLWFLAPAVTASEMSPLS